MCLTFEPPSVLLDPDLLANRIISDQQIAEHSIWLYDPKLAPVERVTVRLNDASGIPWCAVERSAVVVVRLAAVWTRRNDPDPAIPSCLKHGVNRLSVLSCFHLHTSMCRLIGPRVALWLRSERDRRVHFSINAKQAIWDELQTGRNL